MRGAFRSVCLTVIAITIAGLAEAQVAILAVDLDEWGRLSEAQQAAYVVGAMSVWTIHGLRCPQGGSSSLITWRSLLADIAAEAKSLPKTEAVETVLIRILARYQCTNVLPRR